MRGRPKKSEIRKKISTILTHAKTSYGYDIYKKYKQVFGKVEMRTIYYNLQKGVLTGEFIIHDIRREAGNYTWGHETERIYYANGPYATPTEIEKADRIRLERLPIGKEIENITDQIIETKELLQKEVETFILSNKKINAQQREKKKIENYEKIKKLKKYILETPNQNKQKKIDDLNQLRDKLDDT